MGWDFIFKSLALFLGFRVMDVLFDAFQPPMAVTVPIELLYSIGVIAFVALSLLSALKIIFRGPPQVR